MKILQFKETSYKITQEEENIAPFQAIRKKRKKKKAPQNGSPRDELNVY